MKLLIFIGMVIIFISAFFIFFIYSTVVKNNIQCLFGAEAEECKNRAMTFALVFGLFMIGLFLMIDIAVVYIIMNSIASSAEYI